VGERDLLVCFLDLVLGSVWLDAQAIVKFGFFDHGGWILGVLIDFRASDVASRGGQILCGCDV
jgi:hypothetical protein